MRREIRKKNEKKKRKNLTLKSLSILTSGLMITSAFMVNNKCYSYYANSFSATGTVSVAEARDFIYDFQVCYKEDEEDVYDQYGNYLGIEYNYPKWFIKFKIGSLIKDGAVLNFKVVQDQYGYIEPIKNVILRKDGKQFCIELNGKYYRADDDGYFKAPIHVSSKKEIVKEHKVDKCYTNSIPNQYKYFIVDKWLKKTCYVAPHMNGEYYVEEHNIYWHRKPFQDWNYKEEAYTRYKCCPETFKVELDYLNGFVHYEGYGTIDKDTVRRNTLGVISKYKPNPYEWEFQKLELRSRNIMMFSIAKFSSENFDDSKTHLMKNTETIKEFEPIEEEFIEKFDGTLEPEQIEAINEIAQGYIDYVADLKNKKKSLNDQVKGLSSQKKELQEQLLLVNKEKLNENEAEQNSVKAINLDDKSKAILEEVELNNNASEEHNIFELTEEQVSSIDSVAKGYLKYVSGLQADIEDLTNKANKLNSEIKKIKADIEAIKANVGEEEVIQPVEGEEVGEKFNGTLNEEKIKSINEIAKGYTDYAETLEKSKINLNEKTDVANEEREELKSKLAELKGEKVDKTEITAESGGSSIEIPNKIELTDDQINKINEVVKGYVEYVSELESEVGDLSKKLEEVNSEIKAIKEEIEKLSNKEQNQAEEQTPQQPEGQQPAEQPGDAEVQPPEDSVNQEEKIEEPSSDVNEKEEIKTEEPSSDVNEKEEIKTEEPSSDVNEKEEIKTEEPSSDVNEKEEIKTEEPGSDVNEKEEIKTEEPSSDVNEKEEIKTEEPGSDVNEKEEIKTEEPSSDVNEKEEIKTEEPSSDVNEKEEIKTEEPSSDVNEKEEIKTEEPSSDVNEKEEIKIEEPSSDVNEKEEVKTEEPNSDVNEKEEIKTEDSGSDVKKEDIANSEEQSHEEESEQKLSQESNSANDTAVNDNVTDVNKPRIKE
ncbi:hypothetical protein [Clostridium sp. ZS2-4]|uniref:hypothetical protein n=1 Tax=Clostridium sp. ZS2-4 TaxID=2987703 RepID=UPI00227AA431|nr:hypothetical protein [Clostridium sp. ZS2-4]MCY6354594.1 hypothetical protein [Clostridium sp. ZS2-4]